MKKQAAFWKTVTLSALIAVWVASTIVYAGSMALQLKMGTIERAEMLAYLLGYIATDVSLAAAICEFRRGRRIPFLCGSAFRAWRCVWHTIS